MRIISISSSRADVGILRPVWKALADAGAELHVVGTGMHHAQGAAPLDLRGIAATLHAAGSDLGGRAETSPAAMGAILADCGILYAKLLPDLVLVIGDRLDMLPAAIATLPLNVPMAHLHGGEVTEGAVDDRIRHAITKLAHLHLASCESAAARIRDMGEEEWRIIVTGAPGLDTLRAAPVLSRDVFLREAKLEPVAGAEQAFVLATVHAETNSCEPAAPMRATLAALDEVKLPVLFTAPNSDPGGDELKRLLAAWIAERSFAVSVDTLGSRLYPSALRHAAAMVGNSSSGIIEAGLFGLPVVDIGSRQKGREAGGNVAHVASDAASIAAAIRAAVRRPRFPSGTPYGDGASGPRVAGAILTALRRPRSALLSKRLAGSVGVRQCA